MGIYEKIMALLERKAQEKEGITVIDRRSEVISVVIPYQNGADDNGD